MFACPARFVSGAEAGVQDDHAGSSGQCCAASARDAATSTVSVIMCVEEKLRWNSPGVGKSSARKPGQ
jgi:hypothetical protein